MDDIEESFFSDEEEEKEEYEKIQKMKTNVPKIDH